MCLGRVAAIVRDLSAEQLENIARLTRASICSRIEDATVASLGSVSGCDLYDPGFGTDATLTLCYYSPSAENATVSPVTTLVMSGGSSLEQTDMAELLARAWRCAAKSPQDDIIPADDDDGIAESPPKHPQSHEAYLAWYEAYERLLTCAQLRAEDEDSFWTAAWESAIERATETVCMLLKIAKVHHIIT